MKKYLFWIVCLFFVLPASANTLLKAIAEVETGSQNNRIGRAGERSQWQMTYSTWRRYTKKPFYLASVDKELAEKIAMAHLEHLKKVLAARGMAYSPYNLALLWNAGENRKSFLARHRLYAQRVASIFLASKMVVTNP